MLCDMHCELNDLKSDKEMQLYLNDFTPSGTDMLSGMIYDHGHKACNYPITSDGIARSAVEVMA